MARVLPRDRRTEGRLVSSTGFQVEGLPERLWLQTLGTVLPSDQEGFTMAVCADCEQEMLTAVSCTVDELIIRGERFARLRAFRPAGRDDRCGDCGIAPAGFHHLGCDLEPCPRCGRQLLSCGCPWLDDETEDLLALVQGTVVHPRPLRGVRFEDLG